MTQNKFSPKEWVKKVSIGCATVFLLTISFFAGLYADATFFGANSVPVQNIKINVLGKDTTPPANVDMATFWKVWNTLDKNFAGGATATATQTRIYGAIQGMVDSLGDPYTTFFTPEENKNFETELSGSLEGVGMVVGIKEKSLVVISPVKNSPASRAGILAGDKILMINDKDTEGMTVEQAVSIIRGKKGTKVKLTFERDGKNLEHTLTRDLIVVPAVETEKLDGGIFIIKINTFNANVSTEFKNALKEFVDGGHKKMIIDLRNNPGGYLDSAVDVASWFIPLGKTIVTEDFAGARKDIVYRSKGYDIFKSNFKVVILVNEGSASASEIVAGALSEYGKAVLVGEKTFGKGSVQEVISITKDTSLKVTVAKWLTPKGKSLSGEGITPDFVVELKDEYIKNGKDPQREKAIQVIKKF